MPLLFMLYKLKIPINPSIRWFYRIDSLLNSLKKL